MTLCCGRGREREGELQEGTPASVVWGSIFKSLSSQGKHPSLGCLLTSSISYSFFHPYAYFSLSWIIACGHSAPRTASLFLRVSQALTVWSPSEIPVYVGSINLPPPASSCAVLVSTPSPHKDSCASRAPCSGTSSPKSRVPLETSFPAPHSHLCWCGVPSACYKVQVSHSVQCMFGLKICVENPFHISSDII